MVYTTTYRRRRWAGSGYNSFASPKVICAGFENDGSECKEAAGFNGCCPRHQGQSFWMGSGLPTLEERRSHAIAGRCCGIAASTGCLCNRKIWGFTFCHSHRDQQPPAIFFVQVEAYYALPARGFELTTKSAQLKEKLMEFCLLRSEKLKKERQMEEQRQERLRQRKAEEEAARARFREQEEERRKKAAEEAERRRKEAEAQQERARQEQEKQRKAEEERQKKWEKTREEWWRRAYDRQEQARKKEEKAQKAKNAQFEGIIEDYQRASQTFDSWKPSSSNPLSFRSIPWPLLLRPTDITFEKITWETVEEFFKKVRQMRSSDVYTNMLNEAKKRYHPDRWAARRVLANVPAEEREQIEASGKTVSQAVNCLIV
ncbi:hypothetical protein VKT23_001549 [Stygiomarasmius scandens]|uniref:Uncharacterized protein n=1 Tax=Marasmiellus scandens TaxID=2682957 RepID=A0ABR1JZR9_9AGAR